MTYFYLSDCNKRFENIAYFKNNGKMRDDFFYNKLELRIEHTN